MRRLLPLAFAAALSPAAFGQAQFVLRFQQAQITQAIADGATLSFASEGIGQTVGGTLTVTYRGSTGATINSFEVSGTTEFTAVSSLIVPATLNNNDAATFNIAFTPVATGRPQARLSISFTEGTRTAAINIGLAGALPDFGFSYVLPRGNQTFLPAGGAIPFPNTTVNQTSSSTLVVTNRGTGPGTVNNITVSGAAFTLGGVPLLPATVNAGQDLRFTVSFAPLRLESSAGSVSVELVGRSASFALSGTGVGPAFSYEFVIGSTAAALNLNDTITLPVTAVGEKSTATVRVRNTGNAEGAVTRITATGAEFTVTDAPFLPLTLQPGGGASFTVTFAPTQPASVTGRLRIDDAFFNLAGSGLGPTLSYSATIGGNTITLANNSAVIYPPTQVTSSFTARFLVGNTGNVPTPINSINVTGAAFTLAELPALPAQVASGAGLAFAVIFTPTALGAATGTLRIDGLTLNLSGFASDPPPLPSVSFSGLAATADPTQQLTAGLSLAAPYPVNLTGRLTLSFSSDVFADDPAVQFAAGVRALSFTVPANSTRAVFALDATQVRLQTGTVAGTITLTATFNTEAGGINLTPATAPAGSTVVRPAAPRLRSVQLAARTATGFTLLVSGFATSRSVTQFAFQFAASSEPGLRLDTSTVSLPVESAFAAYYQGAASAPFGSQFTATVTFNVRGDIEAIQSASVTASNALGASNAVPVNLR